MFRHTEGFARQNVQKINEEKKLDEVNRNLDAASDNRDSHASINDYYIHKTHLIST